ncbi:MAG: S41 family peptidase [Saprospiraceae bacterium]
MKNNMLLLFSILSLLLNAQDDATWLRHVSISPDGTSIAFTYKGDIYKVPATGGDATQLTFHKAHDYKAIWSKDASKIAFASDRYGNFDIFVMDAMGGPANRLTYHSNGETPFSFSADDKHVIFGALRQDDIKHRQYPTGAQPELYSVPESGGRVSQLLTIPAEYAQVTKDGKKMLYHDRKGYENEWRKHHTSSVTRDIWLYDKDVNQHTMLTKHQGEDRHPIFTEDESGFYFLSESPGTFNVFKSSFTNPDKRIQLTNFQLHPIRFLSYGGGQLCFGYDGNIYTMAEGNDPVKIKVRIRTQEKSNADKYISVNGGIREMAVSPDGKEIAFIARGEVFVTAVDHSYTKRITNTPEQERFVQWSHDGKSVIYSSERNSKWSIYESKKVRKEEPFFYASTLITESTLITSNEDNYLPELSPDGSSIAYIAGRRTLKVMNLKSKATTTILAPEELYHMRDGDKYFKWSPDSKWLLIDWDISLSNSDVLLAKADGTKKVNLNKSGYVDYRPKWVNKGKQMLWFSNRNGLKSYATSGRTQSDVFTMFFDKEAWDKFRLSEDDFKLQKELKEANTKDKNKDDDKKDKSTKDKSKKKEPIKKLRFDWDNMEDYKSRLTIHSSRLGDAVLSKDGEKLYYLARFEDDLNLWSTNLRTKETKIAIKLGARSGGLEWDKDQENLYLLADGKISKIDPDKGDKKSVKLKGEIIFDKNAERTSMFDHVWNRTKNIFYHSNFHGIDWDQMRTEYQKYIPSVGNSYEFAELLSEMLGELNVSHAGARYRGDGITNRDATASLGIFMDYDYKADGIKIEEIIKGGPLDKAEVDVKVGNVIEKIDGETISATVDVAKYLNRKTDQFTLLDIVDPVTRRRNQVVIKPISLGAENRLLYKRWVETNRNEVEAKSNGKLGYVHIAGMNDGQFRNTYESMMGRYFDSDAVIIDTRFNGGGDLVADLAMFFTGEPFISYETETRVVGGEPTSRWTKPTLAIFNESMYSDGHCFACGYTDLKLGKTVGMPVPGTCSFAGWEGLPDGSRWGVVPVSAKDKQGNWMENNQTEPQIMIKNMPGMIVNGIDQQLEVAITELLKDVKK